MSQLVRVSLVCLVLALLSIAVLAQAPPSADTYVSKLSPATNYGSAPILMVQEGTTAYVQFDLSAFPAGASLAKATIRLFVNNVVVPGTFDVYQVNDKWDEGTLTYSNAPALGASTTGETPVTISTSTVNHFVVVDVTPLVRGWINGNIANNGIALALASGQAETAGSFSFDSKENNLTGHQPELTVMLGGAAQPCDQASGFRQNIDCDPFPGAKNLFCCRCVDLNQDDQRPCKTYDVDLKKEENVAKAFDDCTDFCRRCGGVLFTIPKREATCKKKVDCTGQ